MILNKHKFYYILHIKCSGSKWISIRSESKSTKKVLPNVDVWCSRIIMPVCRFGSLDRSDRMLRQAMHSEGPSWLWEVHNVCYTMLWKAMHWTKCDFGKHTDASEKSAGCRSSLAHSPGKLPNRKITKQVTKRGLSAKLLLAEVRA